MKRTAVVLAEGFEELEAVAIIDVLRRGGFVCDVVGLEAVRVVGSHGIAIEADTTLEALTGDYDLLALPGGGPGAERLAQSQRLGALLKAHAARGGLVGALCAAPVALAAFGLLEGKRATVYPGWEPRMAGALLSTEPVVRDGSLITGRGPGLSLPFALALVEALGGDAAALATQMLVR